MIVTAVIAEYNPFHNGHAWQLLKARELTGADYLIVLMSGDFVQRGTPALLDKHVRAKMAILGGADLVLELPCMFSTGSAQYFSRGAVSLLDALSCVDFLCFGSECGEISPFLILSDILCKEPSDYQEVLQQLLRRGYSFPSARNKALVEYCTKNPKHLQGMTPGELNDFLQWPNNILGLEYCQALLACHSAIQPVTISRQGSSYHEDQLPGDGQIFPSATAIRTAIRSRSDPELLHAGIPKKSYPLLANALEANALLFEDDFNLLLAAKLLTETPKSLSSYFDITEDLANRIYRHKNEFTGIRQFTALLKTRELTYSRISRGLLHILLNLREVQPPSYERVLGFQKTAGPLLSSITKNSTLPLITKPALAQEYLSEAAFSAFAQDIFAANLYETVRSQKNGTPFLHEYQKPLVLL
ncbi:MAG: nucleotidyltransferase family protein [Fusicatenibacter sp.]